METKPNYCCNDIKDFINSETERVSSEAHILAEKKPDFTSPMTDIVNYRTEAAKISGQVEILKKLGQFVQDQAIRTE